jgi:NAD(P)-dependent dehydrogenase (short-subunit alcohol dehydrogenase family)
MAGRLTVITGASSGIGRATAVLCAGEGADLILLDLANTDLHSVADECRRLGARALTIECDVANAANVDDAFATGAAALGPVSAVFNNAGVSVFAPLLETTSEQWNHVIAVNLTGCFNVLRTAARAMTTIGGTIVNTSSELALIGQAGYVAYTASKGGILSMTRAAASELAQYGIRVNALCPGTVDTPLLRVEFRSAADPDKARQEVEQSVLMGRIGQPEEIAEAALYLLSNQSSYATGAHLVVDGGRTACQPGYTASSA